MKNLLGLLQTKIFCKHCMLTTYQYLKFGVTKALHADTIAFEIFEGILAISTAIVLFFPLRFDIGSEFNKVLFYGYLQDVSNGYWVAAYGIIGILLLYGAIYGSILFRKRVAIVALYLWLCILFYLFKFGNLFSVEFLLYSVLSISSMFTYLSLWRFRWI